MISLNYYQAFIEVADDCPVTQAEIPQPKGARKTKVVLEYEMIARHPYKYTGEDIAFETYAIHKGIPKAQWPAERTRFLAQDQACLRSSALGKRYGWGIHTDGQGRAALVAVESAEYKRFAADPKLQHTKALCSKRA